MQVEADCFAGATTVIHLNAIKLPLAWDAIPLRRSLLKFPCHRGVVAGAIAFRDNSVPDDFRGSHTIAVATDKWIIPEKSYTGCKEFTRICDARFCPVPTPLDSELNPTTWSFSILAGGSVFHIP